MTYKKSFNVVNAAHAYRVIGRCSRSKEYRHTRVTSVKLVVFVLFNMAGGFQKLFARLFWIKQVKVLKKA